MDDYLSRKSEFSRRYRAIDAHEVPSELDVAVVAHATQSVNIKKQAHARWRRFTAPLAVAATTVLAVSIVIQSGTQAPLPTPSESTQRSMLQDSALLPESSPRSVALEAAPPSPSVQITADVLQKKQTANEPRKSNLTVDSSDEKLSSLAKPKLVSAKSAKNDAPRDPSNSNETDSLTREDRARHEMAITAMRQSVAGAIAPASPNSAVNSAQEQVAAIAPPISANNSSAPVPQISAPAAMRAQPASETVTELKETVVTEKQKTTSMRVWKDPDQWLEYIRRLRAAGKTQEADQEWQRFRKAFPTVNVADNDNARSK